MLNSRQHVFVNKSVEVLHVDSSNATLLSNYVCYGADMGLISGRTNVYLANVKLGSGCSRESGMMGSCQAAGCCGSCSYRLRKDVLSLT